MFNPKVMRLALAALLGLVLLCGTAQAHITQVPMRSADHLAIGWARSFAPESYTVKCRPLHRKASCSVLVYNISTVWTLDGQPIVIPALRDRIIVAVRNGHSKIVYSEHFEI